jgi:copper chaperone
MEANTIYLEVENIKCGGCENSIVKGLTSLDGVSGVSISRENQSISVQASENLREALVLKLKAMGYPLRGSVSGLEAGLTNAKSFVSCAIGRLT